MYSISSIIELMSLFMVSGFARTEHIFFLCPSWSTHADSAFMVVSMIVRANAMAASSFFHRHVDTSAEMDRQDCY